MPCVEIHDVSSSCAQSATAQCGLERVVHLRRRAVLGLDDHVGLARNPASTSPRSLSCGSSVKRCSASPCSRSTTKPSGVQRGASAAMPRAAARASIAASAATAAPAYSRLGRQHLARGRAAACRPAPRRRARQGRRAPPRGRALRARGRAASAARRPRACPGSEMSETKRAAPETRLGPVSLGAGVPDDGERARDRARPRCDPPARRAPSDPRTGPPSRPGSARAAPLARLLGRAQHGPLDLRVRAAAAQVAGHRVRATSAGSGVGFARGARSPRRAGRACRTRTGRRPRP